MVYFGNPFRVSVPVDERCEIVIGGERTEVVKEFKYLVIVLSKHGEMEGEVRGRAVQGRRFIRSLARVIRSRNVSMDIKSSRNTHSINLPTLTFGSEVWAWNRAQQSSVCAVEMSYLIVACEVTRQDGESNESVYERCGMGSHANGMNCGEWNG